MKIIYTLLLCLMLVACTTPAPPVVVIEKEYVVRTATTDQKTLPDRVIPAEINTDADLANFIQNTEQYIKLVVKKFDDLIIYYESPYNKKGP